MKKEINATIKLGLFVLLGLILAISAIYFLGKYRKLFGSNIELNSIFKNVNGLRVGNNVRFSGINIGSIKDIILLTDTTVLVKINIEESVQKFIKTDASASIGSDGLMGDMVLIISPGSEDNKSVKNKSFIQTKAYIGLDDVKNSLMMNLENLNLITNQLATFTAKMNNGNGALSKLISDEEFATSLNNTILNLQTSSNEFAKFTIKINHSKMLPNLERSSTEIAKFTLKMNNQNSVLYKIMNDKQMSKSLDTTLYNLKTSSKNLNDNLEAIKNNFILKPFFRKQKKEKEAAKQKIELKQNKKIKKELK